MASLDHVQIAAPPGCEPDARRYFGDLLGLTEIPKPASLRGRGGVWFGLDGGQALHVGVEEPFTPARKAHPALRLDAHELNDVRTRLERAGHTTEADDALPGERRIHTADPWGNRLELLART